VRLELDRHRTTTPRRQPNDIRHAITTIQRSLDQVPDPDTIDEDFFHDHLDAIEEQCNIGQWVRIRDD